MERVFLAADVSNIWKVCKDKYGENARVNFEVLKDIIPSLQENPLEVDMQLCAYIITHPKATHQAFEEVLTALAYDVKDVCMDYVPLNGAMVPIHNTWCVGIAVDAIDKADSYDTFVLVTGDTDYIHLLEYLGAIGKKTIVLSFESSLSVALYSAAGTLLFLTEDIVYRA